MGALTEGNANQVWSSNVSGGNARRRWYHE
jgi:hypothetical protein